MSVPGESGGAGPVPSRGRVEDAAGGGSVALAAYLGGLREYARTPVLLALLVFLPAYLIGAFTRLVPASTVPLAVPGDGTVMVDVVNVYAVFMTPIVTALVGALAGLFTMSTTRDADGRLVVAGARPIAVLAARFALLGTVGLIVSLVAVGTAATTYVPERPALLVGALLLAALIYGLLGLLAGVVVNRLAGVYLAMFGTMIDVFFVQNPLADPGEYAEFLPGYAPVELAIDAGFSSSVSADPLGYGVGWLVGLCVVTAAVLYRRMRV